MTRRRSPARPPRALLDKTVANGCTEAEALAAAEKARAIMAERGISDADLAMGEARAAEDQPARPAWHHTILTAAALCTNTAVLLERDGYVFVGAEPGPEIAVYLRDVALRAIDSGVAAFRLTPAVAGQRLFALRDRAERDFTAAFVERLALRLVDVFRPQRERRRAPARRGAPRRALSRRAGARRPPPHARPLAPSRPGPPRPTRSRFTTACAPAPPLNA